MRCPNQRCTAAAVLDRDESRRLLEAGVPKVRVLCTVGHGSYLPLSDPRLSPEPPAPPRRRRYDASTRPARRGPYRVDPAAQRLAPRPGTGRRSSAPPHSKQAAYRRRMVAQGRCPHCGLPCAPYSACPARLRRQRERARLRTLAPSTVLSNAPPSTTS